MTNAKVCQGFHDDKKVEEHWYRISEGPWRLFGQRTPFITFWQVLRNNSWRSN